jgi:hypothetical protein
MITTKTMMAAALAAAMVACGLQTGPGDGPSNGSGGSGGGDAGKGQRKVACAYEHAQTDVCPNFTIGGHYVSKCSDVPCDSSILDSDRTVVAGCIVEDSYINKREFEGTCADGRPPPSGGGGGRDGGGGSGGRDGGARSGDGGSTSTCQPRDVSSFTPPAYKPLLGTHLNRCTAPQIAQFHALCVDANAPSGQCAAVFGASGTASARSCAGCLVTKRSDSAWGALIDDTDTVSVNVPGCIVATNPAQGACAQAVYASQACGSAACDAACPVTSATTLEARSACYQAADAGGCKRFDSDATSACTGGDGGAISACFNQSTFEALYRLTATAICGR